METLTGRDLKSGGLLESLLRQMDSKHHWFWDHLNSPPATRAQLLVHFQQEWEVYVRDFPLFLRRVHDRCPHPDVRDAIAGNIAEEERGAVSGAGPHSELFLYMMEGLGFSRSQFLGVRLLPEAAAYRRWLDDATTAYWLVGAAVTMVFVEGSVEDRAEVNGNNGGGEPPDLSCHPLVVHHGLDPRYLELKRVHRLVESGHRHDAYRAVVGHARTSSDRRAVRAAVSRSLSLWKQYREAVALCCLPRARVSERPTLSGERRA